LSQHNNFNLIERIRTQSREREREISREKDLSSFDRQPEKTSTLNLSPTKNKFIKNNISNIRNSSNNRSPSPFKNISNINSLAKTILETNSSAKLDKDKNVKNLERENALLKEKQNQLLKMNRDMHNDYVTGLIEGIRES